MTRREAKSCRGLYEKLDILPVQLHYVSSLMLYAIIRIIFTWIQETKINFTSRLHIFLLSRRVLLTQELGYLIDCPVILNISGMRGCVLRINFGNMLLLICFIQLLNFQNIVQIRILSNFQLFLNNYLYYCTCAVNNTVYCTYIIENVSF